jgi:indole-3-glycerol phosphate synthase
MTILEQIKQHKLSEIAAKKELYPAKLLEQSPYFSSACVSMKKYISDVRKKEMAMAWQRKREQMATQISFDPLN